MKYHLYIRLEEQTCEYTSIIHEVDTIDSTSPLEAAREFILTSYGGEFITFKEWLNSISNEDKEHYNKNKQFVLRNGSILVTLLDYKVLTEDELLEINHLLYAKHNNV